MEWGPSIRLSRHADWQQIVDSYRHDLPSRFNIGAAVSHSGDDHLRNRVAVLDVEDDGTLKTWTFGDLDRLSDRLANGLRSQGVAPGDRVAVWLPQSFELVLAHVAAYKAGAIVVPLFINFGWDAVISRAGRSGARAFVVSSDHLTQVLDAHQDIPSVELVLAVGTPQRHERPRVEPFWDFLGAGADGFAAVPTTPDDPAFLCFTSGTTGPPKGALHGHRVLLGHLAAMSATHDLAPRPGDIFWTPADWGWMGGLFDLLFPALYWGMPVVAHRMRKFDAEQTYCVLERFGVQNAFIPPTALRMMNTIENPRERWSLRLRTVASGGEALGAGTLEKAEEALGAHVNEFYGQTEHNLILGNCADLFTRKPGSTGRVLPGRNALAVDEQGNPVPDGTVGELVCPVGDPVTMLGYWQDPVATAEKIRDGLVHTGDLVTRDDDGFHFFVGRNDDIISSAGYRIGPTDIENAISRHPAVAAVAVIGKPDELRGEVVMAVVVLQDDASDAADTGSLTRTFQEMVRQHVGGHAYPREIAFVKELPVTSTGKVRRVALREMQREGALNVTA
jgi:acetyl-CoA synthetase